MIIVSRYLVPKGYTGFAFFPFVFVKHAQLRKDACLVNHEKIHLRQQLELLIVPFYVLYIGEFLVRLFQFKVWNLAYKNISFEREAYMNESNLHYLNDRSFWCFLKYIRKP
ncbi:hypothetical protein [Confluentibacter lentus]|uniref:hypothetical protein n=1 Tax=Confluentibacter lentus TaxID=1699412 RepID=UPI000BDA80C5|nr:hypothetical protein [Confluentibacter lentus]OYX24376.1 MAG: hypothetical protein B7Z06_08995 [Flavobacteriales bacterium 32-35-8]